MKVPGALDYCVCLFGVYTVFLGTREARHQVLTGYDTGVFGEYVVAYR